MKPYFSIIIPTLNEEKYLPQLLNNLCHQTSQEFEVIVVDAYSKDKTIAVAQSFATKLPSLTILKSRKKHVSVQRNLGAKKAIGKVLLFIDADSQLPEYFLDGIKYKLSKKPTDIFTCWIRPDTKTAQDATLAVIVNLFLEASRFFELPSAFGAMLGFKYKAFHKLKGFAENISYAEDSEIVRRAIENKLKFRIYPDPYYIYSFRRVRKTGTLKLFSQFTKLQSRLLANGYSANTIKDYPMGGHYFKQKKAKPNLPQKIKKLFNDSTKTPKK